ncbi:MAG: hypothetical protein LBU03_05200 [Tannerellaceae bacterium]|nr:hypothetical protein [Tannerellaceae bacterium]
MININELLRSTGINEGNFISGDIFLIKLIKDIGFLAIILLSLSSIMYTGKFPKSYFFLPFCLLLLGFPVFISIENTGVLHILAGLRWSLPLFLFIFLHDSIDERFMNRVSYFVFAILSLNTLFQVIELWYMPHYQGDTYFNLAARVPGMFSHAHSCSSFICLSYLIIDEFARKEVIRKTGQILSIIGVVLSMSSTGMICLITMMYLKVIRKWKYYTVLILLIPLVVLSVYNYADLLTNRGEGSSEISISTRGMYFMDGLYSTGLISKTFGYAVNLTSMLAEQNFIKTSAADAFYASFLINMGILYFLLLIIFLLFIAIKAQIKKNVFMVNVIILYGLFSFSVVVTEVFPMNLFIALFISYFIKKNHESNNFYIVRCGIRN